LIPAALLAAVGVACLAAAGLLLRSIGAGYRIGRLLNSTPELSIDDALEVARAGKAQYVRVIGRISSDEEFPDDQNRPLVFRRTRLQVKGANGEWATIIDEREAVPFGVETRQSFIGVDDVALGQGLVVIPRVSVGKSSELPAELATDVPAGTDPEAEVRLTIEQLSAVEHATVVGQPQVRDGVPVMSAGLGRPLIVTILDMPAAMRVLAGGRRGRIVVAAAALAIGFALFAAAIVALLIS
jgi:hypothetical protein